MKKIAFLRTLLLLMFLVLSCEPAFSKAQDVMDENPEDVHPGARGIEEVEMDNPIALGMCILMEDFEPPRVDEIMDFLEAGYSTDDIVRVFGFLALKDYESDFEEEEELPPGGEDASIWYIDPIGCLRLLLGFTPEQLAKAEGFTMDQLWQQAMIK